MSVLHRSEHQTLPQGALIAGHLSHWNVDIIFFDTSNFSTDFIVSLDQDEVDICTPVKIGNKNKLSTFSTTTVCIYVDIYNFINVWL